MKYYICFTILLSTMNIFIGCKKNDSNPTAPTTTVVASEVWGIIMDKNSADYGQQTFEKKSDGSFSAEGTWYYVYQGATVECQFQNGIMAIADTAISYTAQGTATNPTAPTGYQTATFSLNITGYANNGKSYGTYIITFSETGWPSKLQGSFTATRASGSGVTK